MSFIWQGTPERDDETNPFLSYRSLPRDHDLVILSYLLIYLHNIKLFLNLFQFSFSHLSHVRESKTVRRCSLRIPARTGLQSLSVELGLGSPHVCGIPDSLSCNPDSTRKISLIPETAFPYKGWLCLTNRYLARAKQTWQRSIRWDFTAKYPTRYKKTPHLISHHNNTWLKVSISALAPEGEGGGGGGGRVIKKVF